MVVFTTRFDIEVAFAGIEHSKINIVIKAILEELNKIKKNSISDKELHRAKDHLTGRMILGLEASDSLAMYYGGQEILRREEMAPEELVKIIHAVKLEDIVAVANDLFQNDRLNLVLIGPYTDSKQFADILRF